MSMQLSRVDGQDGRKAVSVLVQPEFLDPAAICRFMKLNFPEVYREVWYEIVQANGRNRIAIEESDNGG